MNDRLSDALSSAQSQLAGLVATWTQSKRLYIVEGDGPVNDLMVEQFTLIDNVSEPFVLQLTVPTLDAKLKLETLQLKRITLTTRLSDGSIKKHSGVIASVKQLGAERFRQPGVVHLPKGSRASKRPAARARPS